jgi:hypothetical protein
VSSPLLCCLVVDDLLVRLSVSGVFVQGYADDMSSRGGQISKHGVRTHAIDPVNRRYGATRSNSRSIPLKLDSFHLPGKVIFRGSLNQESLGLN